MKKKSILKVLLLTLLACCLAFALVACGGTTYTVTYDYNDGGATQSTTIGLSNPLNVCIVLK